MRKQIAFLLAAAARQQVTAHDLRDALDAVLAGRVVPHPETRALGCAIVPADILKQ